MSRWVEWRRDRRERAQGQTQRSERLSARRKAHAARQRAKRHEAVGQLAEAWEAYREAETWEHIADGDEAKYRY